MATKRKTTTAVVAGVAAAALLLGGTFAWVSISQMAKNEAAGIVNVGGRLHDDFNGENKDVYVENFTNPYNGGQPIYARVRLDEYMEVGKDAGGVDVDGDGNIDAVPVINGTERDNTETWKPHVPNGACAMCDSGDTCLIHDHWTWTMGGEGTNGGQTVFMPTFNKDKDSLAADVNGTYHGTDATDKVYYDDYVTYVTENGVAVNVIDGTVDGTAVEIPAGTDANALTEANKDVTTVTGNAYYDDDPNMDPNDYDLEAEIGGYRTETETHTAKQTATAEVITMEQWLSEDTENGGKAGQPGDFWVYDTDGWAYWANPIMPGEATGLLLDGIVMEKNPGEKCYYAINVVGQFATVNDWEKFGVDEEDEDYPSENALAVLTAASGNVPVVTVTNQDKITLVERGDSVNFSASTVVGATATLADNDEYDWVVLDENFKESKTSTVKDNGDGTATLKVGAEELSAGLYVAAHSRNHSGAVGLSAVAVQIYNVTITEANNTTVIKAGNTLNFSASVVDSITGKAENSGVTWSLRGNSAGTTTNISQAGVLTIDADEPGATVLTVTATSNNGSFVETYTVTVADKYTVTVSMVEDNDIDPGDKLTFTAKVTKNGETDTTSGVNWTVTGGNGKSSINQSGVLTIDESEQGATTFDVKATSKGDSEISDTLTVTISDQYAVTVTSQLNIDLSNENGVYRTVYMDNPTTAYADDELTFTAKVTKNGSSVSSGFNWSVSGGSVSINSSGVLTVPASMAHNTKLTVTATSTTYSDVAGTYPITVYDGYTRLQEITPGTLETIKIDGMRWFTLKKDGDSKALIWAAQVKPGKSESYFYNSQKTAGFWGDSVARSYLNGEFLDSMTVLKDKAVETTITTADDYNRDSYTDTQDKVFLPTEADIFGTAGRTATSDVREYTLGVTGIIINEGMRKAIDGEDSWLRSPGTGSSTMPQLQGGAGTLKFFEWATKLRPAMWVDITK